MLDPVPFHVGWMRNGMRKTDKLLGAIRIISLFLDANYQFLSVRVCKVFISIYCQEAPIRLKYTKLNIHDEIITKF